jgi:hypothetical protein
MTPAPSTATPQAAPPTRGRPRGLGIAIVAGLLVAGLALGVLEMTTIVRPSTTPRQSTTPRPPAFVLGERTPGYLISVEELRERARLAADGVEPYASAAHDLHDFAEDAIDREPEPEDPLDINGTEAPFVDDSAAAYGLGLAYVVSGQTRYADAAARYIMAWVDTTTSTRDACPDRGSCQTSLIVSRTAPGFVFAADLIADSGALSDSDTAAFREWLSTVILPTASTLENNWGDAGAFTAVVLTDYLGDRPGLEAALERWRVQADRIAADGHIPEETRRGAAGMSYTQESLQYRMAVAAIAERYGLDLWGYRGAGGATLTEAIDYLASYWTRPEAWPWDPGVSVPSTGPIWEMAYARSPNPAYVPIIADRRPYGSQGHSALRWTTLTDGVPLEGGSVSGD